MHDQQFDDEIDLGELFLTILGEWRIVAASAFVVVALSAVYAFFVARTEYSAQARITASPNAFCPMDEACGVSLADALSLAVSRLEAPASFGELDAALNLSGDEDFASDRDYREQIVRLAFLRALDAAADGTAATVSVTHSSDLRAVELANAVAAFVVAGVEVAAHENYAALERRLALRLASLPPPTQSESQSDALIVIERSALNARIEALEDHVNAALPVAELYPAAMPLELQSPRRALILVLGAVLGTFVGIGGALVTVMRRGRLHGRAAIAGAFGRELGEIVVAGSGGSVDLQRTAFWQDVRVSLGSFEGGAITLSGIGSDAAMLGAARHLAAEFYRSGLGVAILDLGGRMAVRAAAAAPSERREAVTRHDNADGAAVFSCGVRHLHAALGDLVASGDIVIIVPPPIARDLPAVREAMARSQARVILAPVGVITRHDVGRLILAARGAPGVQVVALTDTRGSGL